MHLQTSQYLSSIFDKASKIYPTIVETCYNCFDFEINHSKVVKFYFILCDTITDYKQFLKLLQ